MTSRAWENTGGRRVSAVGWSDDEIVRALLFFGPDDEDDKDESRDNPEENEHSEDNEEEGESAKLLAKVTDLEGRLRKQGQYLREAKDESSKRKDKLAAFDGLTPDDINSFRDAKDRQEQEAREQRGEYDKQLQIERDKAADIQRNWDKEREDLQGVIIDNAILTGIIGKSPLKSAMSALDGDGTPQLVKALRPLFDYDRASRLVGHRSLRGEDADVPLSPGDFVDKERGGSLALYFETSNKGGSGQGVGDSNATGNGKGSPIFMSREDPQRVTKALGLEKKGDGSHLRVMYVDAGDKRINF